MTSLDSVGTLAAEYHDGGKVIQQKREGLDLLPTASDQGGITVHEALHMCIAYTKGAST